MIKLPKQNYIDNGLKKDVREIKGDIKDVKDKLCHNSTQIAVLNSKFNNHLDSHKNARGWIQWIPGVVLGSLAFLISLMR